MGIGFVLIAWAIIGSVLAVGGALTLRFFAALITRGAQANRRWFLRASLAFPFACLAWAGSVFVLQAVVNLVVFHRDVGLGDGFDCPLPNGYALTFTDTTDIGTVYNPKNHPVWSELRENRVDDVRVMQLAGPYVLGGADTKYLDHFGQASNVVDSYFLLDTRNGTRAEFGTYAQLYDAARRLKIQLQLVPVGSLYSKYRFTWFDALASALLVIPPLIGIALLNEMGLNAQENARIAELEYRHEYSATDSLGF